ncbi:hypothetical protein B9T19_02815 [Ignatzschineria sp. F8392]|uniref:hypothetical protein n=1 Tax=Ignatzschineria sp. F8392 TaxID=1980117 RepID=UPI000B98258C|nr:hypothetical protein [Ignatzschineria sp. F8392]OYQ81614.1 hypothetical protein B9T19_02815 [Ignatzschineria sp. F8392]
MSESIIFNFSDDTVEYDHEKFKDLDEVEKLWRFGGNDKNNWFVLKRQEIENGSNAISLFSSDNHFSYRHAEESENFLSFVRDHIINHTDKKYRKSRKAICLLTKSLKNYLKASDPSLRAAVESISISPKAQQHYIGRALHWDFAYKKPEDCHNELIKSLLYACSLSDF